jgi:hypothetical protein
MNQTDLPKEKRKYKTRKNKATLKLRRTNSSTSTSVYKKNKQLESLNDSAVSEEKRPSLFK